MVRKMRAQFFVLLCVVLLASPQVFAAGKDKLETQLDKESYSIGYQIGLSMVRDGIEIDVETLVQGMQDAVAGKEGLLSEEEMKTLIVDLRKKSSEAQQKKFMDEAARNAEESEKFLKENAKKKGIKTTESGLQYEVLEKGEGATPTEEDTVTVNYRGMLTDGTEFDSSYKRDKPLSFKVTGVIKGWVEALQMMKEGAKWKIYVPPQLGYGERSPSTIPPNSVLVFEIELISVDKGGEEESK